MENKGVRLVNDESVLLVVCFALVRCLVGFRSFAIERYISSNFEV